MRARYYEPSRGRFISEDPAMDGLNWFAYCGNSPLNYRDFDGKKRERDRAGYLLVAWSSANSLFMIAAYLALVAGKSPAARAAAVAAIGVGVVHMMIACEGRDPMSEQFSAEVGAVLKTFWTMAAGYLALVAGVGSVGRFNGVLLNTSVLLVAHNFMLFLYCALIDAP
jgi:hypothetical protein